MTAQSNENLPDEAILALAYTSPAMRDRLRIFLELDHRIGRIVAATSEPMLGQMRLAWWRDMLAKPVSERPQGDAVLDGIGEHWAGQEHLLVTLVDGWEHLLMQPPLSEEAARLFVECRMAALTAVYVGQGMLSSDQASASKAARLWACADLAANVSLDEERDLLLRLGLEETALNSRLSGNARGLAVLGALGRRALLRGGRPLMEGRGASLVAIRAAIFGR